MKFSFLRVGIAGTALSALALLTGFVFVSAASAQNSGNQQQAATGQSTKNWKDRAEYDLYVKITQTADPNSAWNC